MGASCERDPHGDRLVPLLRVSLVELQVLLGEQHEEGRHHVGNGSHSFLPLINRVGMGLDDLGEPKP